MKSLLFSRHCSVNEHKDCLVYFRKSKPIFSNWLCIYKSRFFCLLNLNDNENDKWGININNNYKANNKLIMNRLSKNLSFVLHPL